MYTPTLLYTTEEHGCSLTTFYVRVEQHEPTLLMIKTCNNEVHLFVRFSQLLVSIVTINGFFFIIFVPMRLDAVGIWCVLFDTLVWTKPKRRQRASAGVFRYGRNIFILIVSGTGQVSMGWHRRWQRLGTRFGTIHGSWCINDYDWWRVSVWHLLSSFWWVISFGNVGDGIYFISANVICRRWTHFLILNGGMVWGLLASININLTPSSYISGTQINFIFYIHTKRIY